MRFLYLLPVLFLAASPALARSPSNRLSDQLNSISPSLNNQRRPQASTGSKAASNQGIDPTGPQTLPVIPYQGS